MFFKKQKEKGFSPAKVATLPQTVRDDLFRIIWIGLALLLLLALLSYSPSDPSWSTWTTKGGKFTNWMGRGGSVVADVLLQVIGLSSFLLVGLLGTLAFRSENVRLPWLGTALLLIATSSVLQCVFPARWMPWGLQHPGGALGKMFFDCLEYGLGPRGAVLAALLFALAMVVAFFRWELSAWLRARMAVAKTAAAAARTKVTEVAVKLKPKLEVTISVATPEPALQPATPTMRANEPAISTRNEGDEELFRILAPKSSRSSSAERVTPPKRGPRGTFQLPPLHLLSGRAESKMKTVDRSWYLEKGNILVQKLKDFGVEGEISHISPGPVITVYEFKPASGVKIKDIANLSDDLTLALSVLSVRIVAPIPGKPVVGIEIPSPYREMVHFRDLIEETPFYTNDIRIPVVLGRLASGEPVVAGLATMPHLLVAGATGTGKSVFINTLICSLLYRYTPEQLRLILVDPKMVELSSYEDIPHLLLPVVVDSKKAAMALRWTVDEMERRYGLMHQYGARHLDSYNEKIQEMHANGDESQDVIPYIVVVIDEYADLMAVVPKDVELSIARLAQKARAAGIHLVLATQRPSTDVVTGTIKANFPSRISFRVASSVDSKTILDRTGSERLLGNGDLLFHSAGFMSLKRMQGAFIADADIERVAAFLKEQGEPEYDERILRAQEVDPETGELPDTGSSEEGQLYDAAVRLVTEKGEASISLIQRHLKIGYNRAATLVEQMEKQGVVGPAVGAAKRRPVLVNSI